MTNLSSALTYSKLSEYLSSFTGVFGRRGYNTYHVIFYMSWTFMKCNLISLIFFHGYSNLKVYSDKADKHKFQVVFYTSRNPSVLHTNPHLWNVPSYPHFVCLIFLIYIRIWRKQITINFRRYFLCHEWFVTYDLWQHIPIFEL